MTLWPTWWRCVRVDSRLFLFFIYWLSSLRRQKVWRLGCWFIFYVFQLRGWSLSKKKKNTNRFFGTQPKNNTTPGWYWRLRGPISSFSVFNHHSNLAMCGTFLQKSIYLPDNCGLPATPKDIYDLNLKTSKIWICVQWLWAFGYFELKHRFFVPKNCTILVFSSSIPSFNPSPHDFCPV